MKKKPKSRGPIYKHEIFIIEHHPTIPLMSWTVMQLDRLGLEGWEVVEKLGPVQKPSSALVGINGSPKMVGGDAYLFKRRFASVGALEAWAKEQAEVMARGMAEA